MLKTNMFTTNIKVSTSPRGAYSLSYQQKLDLAVKETKKSKKIQTVQDFLKEVRTW